MFAIRVVLSLAAFLLGYDAICGEREAGTLKLVLSHRSPAGRSCWQAGGRLDLPGRFPRPGHGGERSAAPRTGRGAPRERRSAQSRAGGALGLWAAAFFALHRPPRLGRDPRTVHQLERSHAALGGHRGRRPRTRSAPRAPPLSPSRAKERSRSGCWRPSGRSPAEHASREGRWRAPEWAAADGYAWERVSARAENDAGHLQDEVRGWVIGRKLGRSRLARNLAASLAALAHPGPGRAADRLRRLARPRVPRPGPRLPASPGRPGPAVGRRRPREPPHPLLPAAISRSGLSSPGTSRVSHFQEVPVAESARRSRRRPWPLLGLETLAARRSSPSTSSPARSPGEP